MAGINFLGSYSGIDQGVIDQLMMVERQPVIHMTRKKKDYEGIKSTWRDINTRLNSLMNKLKDLDSSTVFNSKTVSSTDENIITATATTNAIESNYKINVSKLATVARVTGDKVLLDGQNNDTVLGFSGSFTIANSDGITKNVDITADDSLKTIIGKINILDTGVTNETDKLNVNATIIDGRIVLEDNKTGGRTITLSDTDGTTLNNLGLGATSQNISGQLAEFTVNGISVTRDSNTIDDVVEGVTFTLKKESTEPQEIRVSKDTEQTMEKVQEFIEQYNSTMNFLKEQSKSGNPDVAGSRGKLAGDSTLQRIISTVRNMVSDKVVDVNSPYSTASEIGITTMDREGDLTLDTEKLKLALEKDPDAVKNFFYGETVVPEGQTPEESGLALKIESYIDSLIQSGTGLIANKTDSMDRSIRRLDNDIEKFNQRMEMKEQYYLNMFAKLDVALQQAESQQSWLSSQMAGLTGMMGSINNQG